MFDCGYGVGLVRVFESHGISTVAANNSSNSYRVASLIEGRQLN